MQLREDGAAFNVADTHSIATRYPVVSADELVEAVWPQIEAFADGVKAVVIDRREQSLNRRRRHFRGLWGYDQRQRQKFSDAAAEVRSGKKLSRAATLYVLNEGLLSLGAAVIFDESQFVIGSEHFPALAGYCKQYTDYCLRHAESWRAEEIGLGGLGTLADYCEREAGEWAENARRLIAVLPPDTQAQFDRRS